MKLRQENEESLPRKEKRFLSNHLDFLWKHFLWQVRDPHPSSPRSFITYQLCPSLLGHDADEGSVKTESMPEGAKTKGVVSKRGTNYVGSSNHSVLQ